MSGFVIYLFSPDGVNYYISLSSSLHDAKKKKKVAEHVLSWF